MVKGPFHGSPENFSVSNSHFVKLRPAHSVQLVFSYVVKGIKIKTTAKFPASSRLRFEDTKGIHVTRNVPEKFRDLQETGPSCEAAASVFPA